MNQQRLIAGQPGRLTIGVSGSPLSLLTSHSRASGLTRVVLLLDLELDLIPHRLDLPHLALCPPGFVALLTE